jgi:serine/threonine protein kinase
MCIKNERVQVLSIRSINMFHIQLPLHVEKSNPIAHAEHMREFSWEDVVIPPLPANRGFKYGRMIDEGITAYVYEATHTFYGNCVIKVFKPELSYITTDELSFLKKVQRLPGGIRVYDAWDAKGKWHIAMEHMTGTLDQLITNGMRYDAVLDAIKQIAAALHDLHHIGIVHFDVKPKNIGYVQKADGSRVYKILDFGLAEWKHIVYGNAFQCDIRNRCFEKTAKWYRSCELLLLNEEPITEKADVWSVGCIVFEMIFGTPLFTRLSDDVDDTECKTIIRYAWKELDRLKQNVSLEYQHLLQIALDCLNPSVIKRPSMANVLQRCNT